MSGADSSQEARLAVLAALARVPTDPTHVVVLLPGVDFAPRRWPARSRRRARGQRKGR